MKEKPKPTYVTNFQHVLTEDGELYTRGGRVPPMVKFMASIVAFTSAMDADKIIETGVKCHRRPGRKPCQGLIKAFRDKLDTEIQWACPVCGYHGIIYDWQNTKWDFRGSKRVKRDN